MPSADNPAASPGQPEDAMLLLRKSDPKRNPAREALSMVACWSFGAVAYAVVWTACFLVETLESSKDKAAPVTAPAPAGASQNHGSSAPPIALRY